MMKVSVITVHSSPNYGSCLQSYATQRTIESLGYYCELVDYRRKNTTVPGIVEESFSRGNMSRMAPLRNVRTLERLARFLMERRVRWYTRPFDEFRVARLNLTHPYYSEAELEADPPVADIYVTGSDQVWNSISNGGFDEAYYLAYSPSGARRVAWAASIGRENLDDWEIEPTRDALRRYDRISLRELSGVEIARSLGFSDARLVLDPTLMLRAREWAEIARPSRGIQAPYILVYQLNGNKEFEAYARKASARYGLPLIKLCARKLDAMRGARNLIVPAVEEFVWLFANAAYVITDSFHGTAFSLNLGVPFVSIAPPRFSTRIASILSLTGEDERLLSDFDDVGSLGRPIDFDLVKRRLDDARQDSLSFLKEALRG